MKTQQRSTDTLEKLYNSAQKLMLEKGFVATTVDEICEAAKVTKGSFFHYFKSKEDLAKELVERFAETMGKAFNEKACCAGDDPLDRIYSYIDCAIEISQNSEAKGCLVGTFSQELSESHPEMRKICGNLFTHMIEHFKKDIAEAKAQYIPKSPVRAEELAETFIALTQGAMILAKATDDRSVMERTLRHYRNYLKSIFKA